MVPSGQSTDSSEKILLTKRSLAEGTRELRSRDPKLGLWLDRVGPVKLRRQRHQFGALCRSILAQQIGSQAARSIHSRFLALFSPEKSPAPERLLTLTPDEIQACGVSRRKVEYLRALATEFHAGMLRNVRLAAMTDEDVIDHLTRIPGIGVWTAEMFLLFSLGRIDIFSVGDLALRAGVERVEGKEMPPHKIAKVARRWSPYRSVASLYLWKIAHWED